MVLKNKEDHSISSEISTIFHRTHETRLKLFYHSFNKDIKMECTRTLSNFAQWTKIFIN